MICEVCSKEIEPNEPAIQLRFGYLNEKDEFVPEEDIAYQHNKCP